MPDYYSPKLLALPLDQYTHNNLQFDRLKGADRVRVAALLATELLDVRLVLLTNVSDGRVCFSPISVSLKLQCPLACDISDN